ncbi:hypothetical protein NMS_0878 [Nonlabens marinus S1-08]|uniref:Uncharacterized protein n=1 Tax=Nonlabens marinus S1-08 TaxID=1454201 RepID=W8VWN1_9FLAO|nr:hypothetical protein NMS_0878 [Nonlabens marinus S1-08]
MLHLLFVRSFNSILFLRCYCDSSLSRKRTNFNIIYKNES